MQAIARIAAQLSAERKTVRRWPRAGGSSLWRKPPRVGGLALYPGRLERRPVSFADISPRDRYAVAESWRHRFASTCGGKISIETAPGQGTTVRLSLPYADNAEPG